MTEETKFNLSDREINIIGNENKIVIELGEQIHLYEQNDVKEFIRLLKERLLGAYNLRFGTDDKDYIEDEIDALAGEKLI